MWRGCQFHSVLISKACVNGFWAILLTLLHTCAKTHALCLKEWEIQRQQTNCSQIWTYCFEKKQSFCKNCKENTWVIYSLHDLDLLHLQFLTEQTFLFSQRASFSLRVSVMKAKNLMAKDANGEEDKTVMWCMPYPATIWNRKAFQFRIVELAQ